MPGADLQDILGHSAVGRPFATRYGHHPSRPDQNRVFPADLFGLPGGIAAAAVVRPHKRAQSHPEAADVGAGRRHNQKFGGLPQNEIYLFVHFGALLLDLLLVLVLFYSVFTLGFFPFCSI
jgi:hypothetical protein